MNIYVDFDDCLCETAHYFTNLVWEMFGKKVAYEDVHCFNMQQSFDLTDEEYEKMMHKGHEDEELLSLEVTPGAVEVINEWIRIGERGQKKILNYKNWHDNMYCDEWEVEIDNSENLDKIFKVLGLEIIAVVDKDRKKYMYLDKYEISLDSVKDLGYFIEIEVKKYEDFGSNDW